MSTNHRHEFSIDDISGLLIALNEKLKERGIHGRILIAGGAAMMLGFNSRKMTADIDAVFYPAKEIRECIASIASDKDISEDWMNDGVKGFFSGQSMGKVHIETLSNLTIERLDNESLLALKLTSARLGPGKDRGKDFEDAKVLMKALKISTPEEAFAILEERIPSYRIKPATEYFTQELVDTIAEEKQQEQTSTAAYFSQPANTGNDGDRPTTEGQQQPPQEKSGLRPK